MRRRTRSNLTSRQGTLVIRMAAIPIECVTLNFALPTVFLLLLGHQERRVTACASKASAMRS
jgi:hypothetical protein